MQWSESSVPLFNFVVWDMVACAYAYAYANWKESYHESSVVEGNPPLTIWSSEGLVFAFLELDAGMT